MTDTMRHQSRGMALIFTLKYACSLCRASKWDWKFAKHLAQNSSDYLNYDIVVGELPEECPVVSVYGEGAQSTPDGGTHPPAILSISAATASVRRSRPLAPTT